MGKNKREADGEPLREESGKQRSIGDEIYVFKGWIGKIRRKMGGS